MSGSLAVDPGEVAELRGRSPEAFQLLGVLAFLGAEPVPAWVLAEGREVLPSPLSSVAEAGGEALTELVRHLRERGWASEEDDGVRLVAGVASAVREAMVPRDRGRMIRAAVGMLHRSFPDRVGRGEDRRRCLALAPHVLAVAEHPGGGGRTTGEAAHLLARLGAFRRSEGEPEAALDAYRRARQVVERGDPVDAAFRAVLADETASVLTGLGHREEAERIAVEALELADEGIAADEPRLPVLLANVGTTFRELDRHERACSCFERALELVREARGAAGRPLAVELQASLADARLAQGRRREAALAAEGALAAAEELWGSEHPQVARAAWMLADALRGRGREERVLELYRKSLAVEEALQGENHPAVGQKALALGLHLEESGDREGARDAYDRARRVFTEALGPESEAAEAAGRHLARLTGRADAGA